MQAPLRIVMELRHKIDVVGRNEWHGGKTFGGVGGSVNVN
jgi:hypothetical protein